MNQQGIAISFNHGMNTLFINWLGVGAVLLLLTALVAVSVGVVYLLNPRRRQQ